MSRLTPTSISERICPEMSPNFPCTPPVISFFGIVDIKKFQLIDNDDIGLTNVIRNSSAVFKTWTKVTAVTDQGNTLPKGGWYANYIYAMLPHCKPHLRAKCEGYNADTTPFRKEDKKAFVHGYVMGFCNMDN